MSLFTMRHLFKTPRIRGVSRK